jgi:hypothetical protein
MPVSIPTRIACAVAAVAVPTIILTGCGSGGTETVTSTVTTTDTTTATTTETTAASSTVTQASAPTQCANENLDVTFGQGQAGAGSSEVVVVLTNNGMGDSCTLGGYPGMAFYSANGTELAGTVKRGGTTLFTDPGPTKLTLAPNGSASYSLGFTDAQNNGCENTGSVKVTPPNATQSIKVATTGQNVITVCEGQPLTVSALVKGSGGAPQ